ncbi:MAG: type VI secretion system protein TssA [Pseudomonadota bacterium]|jgi:type VI secretion system protein ImpA|nr:type VI secretion system protein TssA [Alphaproteobacteria bacterium]
MSYNSLDTHKKLLEPIATNNKAGDWLRYDPLYVKIRDARREENDGLSRESWEGEIKSANWQEVESLTLDLLENKTKDLQLFCWLIEARLHLYGFDIFAEDISLLLKFIKAFWEDCHPSKKEDPNQEFRAHILESFLRSTTQTIISEPFKELASILDLPINLALCYENDTLERLSKKGGDANNAYQKALANGLITIGRIRNAFSEVQKEKGEAKKATLEASIKNLNEISQIIDTEAKENAPDFSKLTNHLQEMVGLYSLSKKSTPQSDKKTEDTITTLSEIILTDNESPPEEKEINTRSEVYQTIRQLGKFLLTIEPHSPTPALLKLIGEWENKTLSQILKELQSIQPETRSLLELLARATQQEKQPTITAATPDTNALSNMIPG